MSNKKIFYGWWVVLGCFLISCTMVPLVMALFNIFLIQVTKDLGITRSSFTLANTILLSLGIFLSPIVAKHLVKGNMKKIQTVSIIGFAATYASFALAQSVYHLYISAFFVGIFYLTSTLIPISIMITNWFEKQRGLAMSIAMGGIGIGGAIFSPVISYFLTTYGWRSTYCLMSLIVLAVALPTSMFILYKKPEDIGLKPCGADEPATGNKVQSQKPTSTLALSVGQSKTKLFFWLLMFGMIVNGIINTGALGQYPPAIEEMHGTTVRAAIISMYSFIGLFGKLLLGWINDRYGVIASTIFGFVLFGLSFVFMLMGDNIYMLYAMAIALGFGMAIGTVTPPLITAAVYGTDKFGEAYGISNSAMQIGLSTGSLLVASIFDATGSYTSAWILMTVVTVLALISYIWAYLNSRQYCETSVKTGNSTSA